jgi:hypothetical protein
MIQKGKTYYIYQHKRLTDDSVFYVGKGYNGRSMSYKNRNTHWHNIVKKDKGFNVEIVEDNLTEKQAFTREVELIKELGMDNLTNMTEGGIGGDTLSNHPNKKEIGESIRKQIMGKDNQNYGKGYHYWWVQKHGKEKADQMQKELNERIGQAQKGKPKAKRNETFEQTCRKKWGKDFDGKWKEMRKKISDSKKEYWKNKKESA